MATYIITLKMELSGDPVSAGLEDVARWIEENVREGRKNATLLSITAVPDGKEYE